MMIDLVRSHPAGSSPDGRARIVLINSVLANNDAISASVRDLYHFLTSEQEFQTTVFAYRNDFADVRAHIISNTGDLLLHPDFLAADLIIWNFGVYYDLFNGLLVGNGRAPQIVAFHNVTPKEFLPEKAWPTVELSLRQCHHLTFADEVWAVSRVNGQYAQSLGVQSGRITTIPLMVEQPPLAALASKAAAPCEILYVGRFVQSKGVVDLVEAVARLRNRSKAPVRLTLVGNTEFSDAAYVADVQRRISAHGLSRMVVWQGTVDDQTLHELYRQAHILAIPSYHEGFCKPVVEGLRAGCIPVGYAGYNLPEITSGLGRIVPTGDVEALAATLDELSTSLGPALAHPDKACLPLDRGLMSVAQFDRSSRDYVQRFTSARIKSEILSRISAHIAPSISRGSLFNIRPNFLVLPDSEMRERTRPSLNRLPDIADWEPGNSLTDRMREMNEPVTIHRKSWEYAICVDGLRSFDLVKPDAQAIAVGAGSERPLYYFANHIGRMVATDLYDNPQHEGTPVMLNNPANFAPFPYREDRLEVLRMPGDQLDFANSTFDFAFCLSSIEHFGSRDTQRRALAEMMRVVRPGGILCIITELILTDHSHDEYFRWEEIEDIFLSHPNLQLVGGDPDLSISESLIRYPVDLENSKHIGKSPHIVLKKGGMLWTSFSMFLKRLS